jgi:hypothetical protein
MPPARIDEGWILQVRRPSANSNISTKEVRKIYIHNRMNVINLAECLHQCLGLNNNSVAGLFCEATHTFYSLQHILFLTNPEPQQRIYCIELPSPEQRETQVDRSWYNFVMEQVSSLTKTTTANGYFLTTFLLATLVYYQYQMVHETVRYTYSTLYESLMEEPLRELYRYGPWFIGWEGEDLPTICARITYHGDAQFWLRNTAECARIYNAKEQAFLRISRPFLYVFFLVLLIGLVRFLIREYQSYQLQLRSQFQHPQERDMADLYQAFHVILRQVWQVQPPPPSRPKGHGLVELRKT